MPTTIATGSGALDQLDYVRPVYSWRQQAVERARSLHSSRQGEPAHRGVASADQRRQACAERLIELDREILAIKLQMGDPVAGAGYAAANDRIALNLIRLGSCEIERAEIIAEIAGLDANAHEALARRMAVAR
jgi:hypothetical protein